MKLNFGGKYNKFLSNIIINYDCIENLETLQPLTNLTKYMGLRALRNVSAVVLCKY